MPSLVSIHTLQVEVCVLFVTWHNKTTLLRCHAYLWVRAPRSMSPPRKNNNFLLIIGILIVSRKKNALSKTRTYKYVLPLKSWVDWITTRQAKMSQPQKCMRNFEKKCPENKKHIFPLMITFYNFTLKIETSWAKKVVKSILETWNVNNVIAMFILFFFG